jgi:alpha-amylase
MQVQMSRAGNVNGRPMRMTKAVTLEAGSNALEIAYLVEGLSPGEELHLAVEFNFAGLPAGADDRFFHDGRGNRWGQLGTQLDLSDIEGVGLVDQWLGIDAGLRFDRPTHLWTYPIATVSQSEGGFELVHQSVCVLPHWHVQADADGRWSVSMSLVADTSLAENRREATAMAGAV